MEYSFFDGLGVSCGVLPCGWWDSPAPCKTVHWTVLRPRFARAGLSSPTCRRETSVLAWGEHERNFRWWDSPAGVAMPVVGLSHALQNSSLDCFAPTRRSGRAFESHSITQKQPPPKGTAAFGAGGGTRTHTMSPSTDFESVTSTNSITPACEQRYYSRHGGEMQGLFFLLTGIVT